MTQRLRDMNLEYPLQIRYGDGVIVALTSYCEGVVIMSPTEGTREDWAVGYTSISWADEYDPRSTASHRVVEIL